MLMNIREQRIISNLLLDIRDFIHAFDGIQSQIRVSDIQISVRD